MRHLLSCQKVGIIRLKALLQWIIANHVMLTNAGSLVGTTAVTSGLGFIYWWVAAQQFSPEAVGIASATISIMALLGDFSILGLGTLLITELPRRPGQTASLISSALVVVGGVGGVIGLLFAVVAPYASVQFNTLIGIADTVLFAVGVSLSAITLVLDQALIGILRGNLQFWRNTFFAGAKLILLFGAGLILSQKTGMAIYTTWMLGMALSLVTLASFALFTKRHQGKAILPQWGLLRKLGPVALKHHLFNLILQGPALILPILVTMLLSAKINAWFYVSWMIANFVFVVPYALTTVLQAMGSAHQSSLRFRARITIWLSFVTGLIANCFFQLAAKQVLEIFGGTYAEQAVWCLRILVLGAFPIVITNHYISLCRIQDRVASAIRGLLVCGVLELVGATLGARLGGLVGLSSGWVLATTVEALFMFPTVYRATRPVKNVLQTTTQENVIETDPIWLIDTLRLATNPVNYMLGVRSVVHSAHIKLEPMRSIQQDRDSSYRTKSRLKPVRLKQW